MIFGDDYAKRHRELSNTLASIQNIIYAIMHKSDTWDNRIKAIQNIDRSIPDILRYMIYFKNKQMQEEMKK